MTEGTRLSTSKFRNTEKNIDFMKWYFDDDENVEEIILNEFCEVCMAPTGKLCSRCYSRYYCSKECQNIEYHNHKFKCYPIDGDLLENSNTIFLKALRMGLFNRTYYLGEVLKRCTNVNVVVMGRYLLYQIIINLIFNDPVSGVCDSDDVSLRNEIYKAGRTLARGGGNELYSYETWKFIPKNFHDVILQVFSVLS